MGSACNQQRRPSRSTGPLNGADTSSGTLNMSTSTTLNCEFESAGPRFVKPLAASWYPPDPRQIPLEGKSVSTFAHNELTQSLKSWSDEHDSVSQ
jgi:hypothetical protein